MHLAKDRVEELAVFGGDPAFADPVHVGRPFLPPDRAPLFDRIGAALDRGRLTNGGPLVEEFEDAVRTEAGTAHAVATSSGTAALQIAARALDLEGEVILPSFTFPGSAHALSWAGLTPVFADIDPATGTLDPSAVEALVGPRTTAVLGVHLFGRPCEVEDLDGLAARHGLMVFYDAAHAFGSRLGAVPVGGFGDAEVFSFHATKLVHCFEGGALVTDDPATARRARRLRNFGYEDHDHVTEVGTNAKLSEPAAAMGLTCLDRFDDLLAATRRRHEVYTDALAGLDGVTVRDPGERTNHSYLVLEVDAGRAGIGADDLVTVLRAENVLARRYFAPGCHRLEPYRNRPDRHSPAPLPATETLAARTVCLPTGPALTDCQATAVAELVRVVTAGGPRVHEQLSRSTVLTTTGK